MSLLADEISVYLRQLSPHVAERLAAKLLHRAKDELVTLQTDYEAERRQRRKHSNTIRLLQNDLIL